MPVISYTARALHVVVVQAVVEVAVVVVVVVVLVMLLEGYSLLWHSLR